MDNFLNNIVTSEDWDPINLIDLKDYLFENFSSIVKKMPDKTKSLFFDQASMKLMNYILPSMKSFEQLKIQKGIYVVSREFFAKQSNIRIDSEQALFIIYPSFDLFKDICDFIAKFNENRKEKDKIGFHIIIIPSFTYQFQNFIKENNYNDLFKLYNWQVDLIPFDRDLMSMELENAYKEIYIDNNYSSINLLAKAIVRFEHAYGKFEYKYIKGDNAAYLDSLIQMEEKSNGMEKTPPELSACIMIDRSVDSITPLCSQYTYEGMLDEHFSISFNKIKVKESVFSESEKEKDKERERSIDVSYTNAFFNKFRNMHFVHANQFLRSRLDAMKDVSEKTKKVTEKDDLKVLNEQMEKFNKIMKEEKVPMTEHISLAENMNKNQSPPIHHEYIRLEQLLLAGDFPESLPEFYQSEIGKKASLYKLIKLLCIESLTQNGIVDYPTLKRNFMHAYGFQNIFFFRNLEQAGLLKTKNTAPLTNIYYTVILEKLKLINNEFNINNIADSSYVLAGFCPISLKLIEATLKQGWKGIGDVLKKINGKTVYPDNEIDIISSPNKRFVLVVFIGGVTYAEISGIRFLNQINKKVKLIIATTNVINHKKFFDGLNKVIPPSMNMKEYFQEFSQLVD